MKYQTSHVAQAAVVTSPRHVALIAGGATVAAVIVALLTFFAVQVQPAHALSCIANGTAAEEVAKADLVFAGTVAAVDLDQGLFGIGGDESGTITFDVDEVFAGEATTSVTLALGGYTTWYGEPTVGQEAVIYVTAYAEDEPLSMPLCSRSVIGEGAVAEEQAVREATDDTDPTDGGSVAAVCHAYSSARSSFGAFGAPYNTRTNALLLSSVCSDETVTFRVGATNEVVYQSGYYTQGESWKPFTFKSAGDSKGTWRTGEVTYELSRSELTSDAPLYFIAYTCESVGGAWRCGCTDAACTSSNWQIQRVDLQAVPSVTEPVACTMDAKMCPDGSYVGRVAPSCEFAACPGATDES